MARPDTRAMMLRSVAEADAAMQQALLDAARDAEKLVNNRVHNISDEVSEAQLLRVMEELRELAHDLWGDRIPQDVARVIAMAQRRSMMGSDALDELMLRGVGNKDQIKRLKASMRQRAKRVVQVFQTRERSARFELSPRVYKWEAWHNGKIERILSSQFARGASARDIARAVREFIDPNTAGGASYAAKRLARTEVANAFHEQTRRDYAGNPFVTGLKWQLSRSHSRKDPCDALAIGHSKGLAKGVYVADETPDKPHPQCLCHTTPETVSEEKFQDEFFDGAYNNFLLDKYDDIDPEDLPPYEQPVKKTVPKKTPTKKKSIADIDRPMFDRKGKGEVRKLRTQEREAQKSQWDALNDEEKQKVRKAVVDHSKAPVHVRMSEKALNGFLDKGRMKSIHELKGKDEDYIKQRKSYEDDIMGYADKKDSEYPIYGYASDDINTASGYGDFAVTLKEGVRKRATMSAGDSLNGMLDVRRPDEIESLGDKELMGMIGRQEFRALVQGEFLTYMEAQIPNIKVSDIESITVPSDASDELIQRLRKAGIKVIVQKSEEDLLMEELMRKLGK